MPIVSASIIIARLLILAILIYGFCIVVLNWYVFSEKATFLYPRAGMGFSTCRLSVKIFDLCRLSVNLS